MKAADIREFAAGELGQKETELREELFNLKFQHAIGKLENTTRLKALKKDIARVQTVKSESTSKEG